MTIRDIERWIHLGVLLPFVALILAAAAGLVQVHDGYFEFAVGSLILMCVSGLVALINALRLLPKALGSDRQRLFLCAFVGAVFGIGPLVLVANVYFMTRTRFGV